MTTLESLYASAVTGLQTMKSELRLIHSPRTLEEKARFVVKIQGLIFANTALLQEIDRKRREGACHPLNSQRLPSARPIPPLNFTIVHTIFNPCPEHPHRTKVLDQSYREWHCPVD